MAQSRELCAQLWQQYNARCKAVEAAQGWMRQLADIGVTRPAIVVELLERELALYQARAAEYAKKKGIG